MEFTLSRVTLGVCGIVLLAAVLSPVTSIYDEREDVSLQEQCDLLAEMIDTFYYSDTDNMTLNLNSILPSATCTLTFDGQIVKMTSEDKEYSSICIYSVSADDIYDSNDIVKFTKINGEVIAKKI